MQTTTGPRPWYLCASIRGVQPDCQPHGLRCSHFLLATCRLSFGQAKRELDARCPVVTQVSLYADVDGSWTRSLGKHLSSDEIKYSLALYTMVLEVAQRSSKRL